MFGVGAHAVHPKGYDVLRESDEFMESLTAPVLARGKFFRDV
jgi:acetyl/propionyl-CoA carboxylase alpha subunit